MAWPELFLSSKCLPGCSQSVCPGAEGGLSAAGEVADRVSARVSPHVDPPMCVLRVQGRLRLRLRKPWPVCSGGDDISRGAGPGSRVLGLAAAVMRRTVSLFTTGQCLRGWCLGGGAMTGAEAGGRKVV